MKIAKINPKKSISKAFLKQRPLRSEIELFKSNLIRLLNKVDEIEREENQKNHIRDFLRDTFYKDTNEINTKDTKDLVIHLGKSNKDKVGVIIEAKRPGNKNEMLSEIKPNSKAFQELILYYLRERIEENNIDIKYLIATNIYEWYIFDASSFEKLFFRNKSFIRQYEEWRDGQKVTKDTNLFYESIAKPFIDELETEVHSIYFDIRNYEKILRNEDKEDDKNLIALYKLLSPYFLLKVPFANDSNSLNEKFYKELLHIIGLEEVKEGTKNIIRRKEKDKQAGSLIENTINILLTEDTLNRISDKNAFGATKDEQLFSIALELSLTWINRILFLKLLEGQLIAYHKGSKDYRFLNSETINDFDELYKLFHQVLARSIEERSPSLKQKYSRVPYLNSSLFEISELENLTIKINSLDNSEKIELITTTILKEEKKKNTSLPPLEYLFKFLDAYDFASEGAEDIAEDNKSIINASVLGKVFEKINGYKDGSIFTPGFITMYMSRQSLRSAIVQKFNEHFKSHNIPEVSTFDELYNRIDKIDIQTANTIINSLKICDPAVGSGHFLVSVLNELIVIKSELGILTDKNSKLLKHYEIIVDNDELIISDEDGIFQYNYRNKESQRVQETIFNEKQTIIENCLFGVDINPNSVKICRLRLWIELLKSSYYKISALPLTKSSIEELELETLPNIDINIKCGNSLISRYALDADLKKALQKSKWNITSYRLAVMTYRNAKSKDVKREMEKLINEIKGSFETELEFGDKRLKKLNSLNAELLHLNNQGSLFGKTKAEKAKWEKDVAKLSAEIKKQEEIIEEVKNNAVYKNAFEWRFEFPEVLNDNGDFEGFDVVIGNPPYVRRTELNEINKKTYEELYYSAYKQYDLYLLFIERSLSLLKMNCFLSFINPIKFFNSEYGLKLRELLIKGNQILSILDVSQMNIFESAMTYPCVLLVKKGTTKESNIFYFPINNLEEITNISKIQPIIKTQSTINKDVGFKIIFNNNNAAEEIINKINGKSSLLNDYFTNHRGLANNLINFSNSKHKAIKSSFVKKYYVKDEPLFVDYLDASVENRFAPTFSNELIIIPRTVLNLQSAIKNKLEVILDRIYYLIPIKPVDINVVVGLINSKLINYWFNVNYSSTKIQGGYFDLRGNQIATIPLIPEFNGSLSFSNFVDQIIKSKKRNPKADTTDLERQIDIMVYKLYDLTYEEIKIIDPDFPLTEETYQAYTQ